MQGSTNTSQFLIPIWISQNIRKRMTTAFWLTSRQVYLRIVIYPRSDIFFYIASIIIVLHISGGCTLLYTLRTRLTRSKFAVQGRGSFFALTSFLLKAWESYRGLCLLSGGPPNTQDRSWIPPDTLMPRRCWSLTDLCFGIGRSPREPLRPH
jgi:hypothetical protein